MTTALKGLLHGNTITLAETVPILEGQRVHVLIEPVAETALSAQEQEALWRRWAEQGARPISVEDAELP